MGVIGGETMGVRGRECDFFVRKWERKHRRYRMKRLCMMVMVMGVGASVAVAAMTKEQYLEQKKAQFARQGKTISDEQLLKAFAKLDTDGDGVLSKEELAAAKAK
jgi:hypothetical protein